MSTGHALLSPSSAKRWMACPGSLALTSNEPDDSSEYADEGTAAHWLAAHILNRGSVPSAIRVVDGVATNAATKKVPPPHGVVRTFDVTPEMLAHVHTYTHAVMGYAEGGTLFVEQALPIGHITGEEGAVGTGDAVVITPDGEMQVHDFKYGMMEVDARDNPQLKLYLLGAIEKFAAVGDFDRYRTVIHQPRVKSAPQEQDYTLRELIAFQGKVRVSAVEAMSEVDEHRAGKAVRLVPGAHCRETFCKARAKCPALATFVEESVGAKFEALAEPIALVDDAVTALDHAALGDKMRAIELIENWCTAIRAQVQRVLIDNDNDPHVMKELGYKLVQGKRGNRQWRDPDDVEKILRESMRLTYPEVYKMTLKSPPALEKELKPKQWVRLQEHVTQSPGGLSVAPISDTRPSAVIAGAEMFDVLESTP